MRRIRQILSRVKIGQKLIIVFLATSMIALGVNLFVYINLNTMLERIDAVYSTNINLNKLSDDVKNVHAGLTGYLETKGTDDLELYYRYSQEIAEEIELVDSYIYIMNLLSDLAKQTTHYTEVLEEYISQDLAEYHAIEPKNIKYKNLIVFGSDMGFIKALAGQSAREYCYLSREQFDALVADLLHISPESLARKLDIKPSTAPLLLPTALMVKKMLDYMGVEGVHMPDASLTEGVMYGYAWRHKHYDLVLDPQQDLISAARHVAKRYKSEKKHINFVEEASMAIFDATKKIHGMHDRERTLLRVTALLHEVGKFINIANPNPSTYSIIDRTELIGMSEQERKIVAFVGRYYTDPKFYQDARYAEITTEEQVLVSKLTAILRIADALDASHRQKLREITVTMGAEGLIISGDTMYDMTYDKWFFESHTDLFEQFFSVKASLRVRRQIR